MAAGCVMNRECRYSGQLYLTSLMNDQKQKHIRIEKQQNQRQPHDQLQDKCVRINFN